MQLNIIFIDSERCDCCGTCVAVCPADAIELQTFTIRIDVDKCTTCGQCVDICPLGIPEVAD